MHDPEYDLKMNLPHYSKRRDPDPVGECGGGDWGRCSGDKPDLPIDSLVSVFFFLSTRSKARFGVNHKSLMSGSF